MESKMEMQPDMCVPCGEGFVNISVGALIVKDGRIKMGETAQGKQIYEIAFCFLMDVPKDFEPVSYAKPGLGCSGFLPGRDSQSVKVCQVV